ncbi:MAG: hydrogenase maturation protease [Promethearchaeota archaeon]
MVLEEKYLKLQESLEQLFISSPKILILGIGENRMGDDGAGQLITFKLDSFNENPKICIINGGITPEERLDEIIAFQPELMLIIDVIDTKSPRGTIALFEENQMKNYLPISSHSLPLPVFVDRCRHYIPGIKMKLLGIRPFSLAFSDRYALYKEDLYSLDDKEENPNIPFYEFHLTEEMEKNCEGIIDVFTLILQKY